jgi:hypothetical protein
MYTVSISGTFIRFTGASKSLFRQLNANLYCALACRTLWACAMSSFKERSAMARSALSPPKNATDSACTQRREWTNLKLLSSFFSLELRAVWFGITSRRSMAAETTYTPSERIPAAPTRPYSRAENQRMSTVGEMALAQISENAAAKSAASLVSRWSMSVTLLSRLRSR